MSRENICEHNLKGILGVTLRYSKSYLTTYVRQCISRHRTIRFALCNLLGEETATNRAVLQNIQHTDDESQSSSGTENDTLFLSFDVFFDENVWNREI